MKLANKLSLLLCMYCTEYICLVIIKSLNNYECHCMTKIRLFQNVRHLSYSSSYISANFYIKDGSKNVTESFHHDKKVKEKNLSQF